MTCTKCGTEIPEGAPVCPACGANAEVIRATTGAPAPAAAPVSPLMNDVDQVMSVGSYIGMFILSAIPIVNIIMWIVWLVSPNTNKNKKNYIIATIVLEVIIYVVMIGAMIMLTAAGVSLAGYMN